MDSLDFVDTKQIAVAVCRAHKALQNDIKADPHNPARGVLQFQYASLPLVRVGRNWLARRADLAALLNPASTTTAPTTAESNKPRRGRPRKAATLTVAATTTAAAGGAK